MYEITITEDLLVLDELWGGDTFSLERKSLYCSEDM